MMRFVKLLLKRKISLLNKSCNGILYIDLEKCYIETQINEEIIC